eukprot:1761546-Pyramimonas_sp.AAC.2
MPQVLTTEREAVHRTKREATSASSLKAGETYERGAERVRCAAAIGGKPDAIYQRGLLCGECDREGSHVCHSKLFWLFLHTLEIKIWIEIQFLHMLRSRSSSTSPPTSWFLVVMVHGSCYKITKDRARK